ncbi:MAG: glycosyltransferase family 4 protein [Bacteroidota bacterium]
MKTIFFIAPYPFKEAPSQRFRFEQYFQFLEEEGFVIEEHPFYDLKTWKTLYTQGNFAKKAGGLIKSFFKRFTLLFKIRKADYIFIHREMAHVGPPIFEWILAKLLRRKYIYDFDDAIWLPNYSEANKKFHFMKAYWKVKYCMKWAHQISAGNQFLADFAKKYNKNVVIIPTTIDTVNHHNLTVDHKHLPVTIGWTGTHTTLHYLNDLIPILQKLEKEFEFEFLVISNHAPQFELKSLRFVKWKLETEIEDLSKVEIGLMPLKNDIWSEGKCGFKGLQYLALGMATILSPVGVNKSIVLDGENGFLAETSEDWEEKLRALLTNPELRSKMGTKGKQTVENQYSVNANKAKYLSLFQ